MVWWAEPVELASIKIDDKVLMVFKPVGVDLELPVWVTGRAVQNHPITWLKTFPPHLQQVF
jgi:hypothetical protein